MPIKNYTTEVDESKTMSEIVALLVQKGAKSVQMDYDANQRPTSISFVVTVMDVPIPFKLPCDFEGVYKYMAGEYRNGAAKANFLRNPKSKDQARRVAWRIIKDWVGAQMAMIDAGQASVAQVFLPYVRFQEQGGITMYEKFLEQVSSQKSLPSGDGKNGH